ncbi:MAG: hypothetical protein RR532_06845 [Erysipelothrix sp.]
MNGIFQKTALKTIFCDEFGNRKIENLESTLVNKVSRILSTFYYDGKNCDCPLENKTKILRGFRPSIIEDEYVDDIDIISSYFDKFFIVGEKGNAYRKDITTNSGLFYFNSQCLSEEIEELIVLVNKILSKNKYGSIDYKKLENLLGNETDIYMFLINLAHNIGNKWKNKSESPFVSATHGRQSFDTALEFAKYKNENKYSYIIFSFITDEEIKKSYLADDFYTILKKLDANWYEDIHEEIIINNAIFPHSILGVFQIDNNTNEKNFIVNPNLYNFIKFAKVNKKYNHYAICNSIYRNGILTDQQNFDEYAIELGYLSYGVKTSDGETYSGVLGKKSLIRTS